jgi:CENP-B N-terminal DNA-binding domain
MSTLQPHPPELKERGYHLYEQGKSNREIAKELGIPINTLARWSSKGKWKLRKQLAAQPQTVPGSLAPADLAEISQLSFEQKRARYAQMMAEQALRVAYTVKSLPSQALIANADKIKKLDETARKALNLEENKPTVVVNVALLHELSERRRAKLLSRDTGRLDAKPMQIADAVEVAKETGAQN